MKKKTNTAYAYSGNIYANKLGALQRVKNPWFLVIRRV